MTKFKIEKICSAIAIIALASPNLPAATFVVNNNLDSGAGSLRQAVIAANAANGGNIIFSNVTGKITLSSALPTITASVNINGPGTNALTVSGAGQFSVFSLAAGTTNSLSNLTIADGFAQFQIVYSNGPVYVYAVASGIANSGTLNLSSCTLSNCITDMSDGGAIFNSGTLVAQNCLLISSGSQQSDSQVYGGAIYNSGALNMSGCTISDCVASRGGGVYNSGTSSLSGCLIEKCENDYGEGDGGGIYNNSGSLALVGCTVSNNFAGWWGGGIASWGNLAMTNTTVANNDGTEGGGLYLRTGTNYFQNCTISGNSSEEYGGGGLKSLSPLVLVNCTISGNTSYYDAGGGIYNLNALTMTDCTVVSNNAAYANIGSGVQNDPAGTVYSANSIIANNGTNDFSGNLISQSHNLIKFTNGCALSGNVAGNIYGIDPLLGPLQNNGGLTMTHALLAGSPAIDAGPANTSPNFDQRGLRRPHGVADDIGAFEFGAILPPAAVALIPSGSKCFRVTLAGVPGFTYQVLRGSSPVGPWTLLGTVTAGCDGSSICLDANAVDKTAFYRAAANQPIN